MNELELEGTLSAINHQLGDINYAINGVGPKEDTSIAIRLVQIVNVLKDLQQALAPTHGVTLAAWLTFVAVVAHVWHHW